MFDGENNVPGEERIGLNGGLNLLFDANPVLAGNITGNDQVVILNEL